MKPYNQLFSQRVADLKPSGIRRFFDIANEMENVISLGVGEPDFDTPWSVRKAGITSLERGKTWYTANAGLAELREEISNYLKRRFDLSYDPKTEMYITVGGSEGIDNCIRLFSCPGDEILIPEPSFVAYSPIASICGATPVPIETKHEDEFRLTAEALRRKITDKTKLLVLPFPNNPTGAVMRKEHLEEIAEVIRDTDIMILSDEIYAELTYGDERHVSIATIPGMKERTIISSGFSKAYAMTGWRMGYVCAPPEVLAQMLKIHQYALMCAPTTSQYAALEAIKNCDEEVVKMRDEYDMRRKLILNGFREIGFECFEPQGAFYVFPCIKSSGMSSDEFCEELLHDQRVALVPGNAFGDSGEGFVRVSYSYSTEHILEALARIDKFMKKIKQ